MQFYSLKCFSLTIDQDELQTMTLKMPGCHHGGFALYELMLQHLKNIKETPLTSTSEDGTSK